MFVLSFHVLSHFQHIMVFGIGIRRSVVLWIFLAELHLQKVGLISVGESQTKICPSSRVQWINLEGDYCYFLEKTKVSGWDVALQNCEAKGGSLASFHSRSEIDNVRQLYKSHVHEDLPYIGLHELSNGNLQWSDGTAVDFVNWASGVTRAPDLNCTQMGYYTGYWYRVHCNASASYICSTPKRIPCASGLCKNGGYCTMDGINERNPCTCKHGFQGLTCSEKIRCDSFPCKYGGTCNHDDINGVFNCTCKHGYTGRICEERIMCAKSVCKNGGSCFHKGINGVFRCDCAKGYKGLTCEEIVPKSDKTVVSIVVPVVTLLAIVSAVVLFVLIRRRYKQQPYGDMKKQSEKFFHKEDSLDS